MSNDKTRPIWQRPIAIIGVAVGVLVLVLAIVLGFVIPQNVLSEGNQREARLSASYADGANYLSNCVIQTQQVANVAEANAAAFSQVIRDAVAGTNGLANVDTTTAAGRNTLLPLLVQAYPQLDGQTALFQRVVDTINGCRDDFRNKQSAVLDLVRDFNAWRTGSFWVRSFGGDDMPNEQLYISLPGIELTGEAALNKMRAPIVDTITASAYQSGITGSDGPFASTAPASPTD